MATIDERLLQEVLALPSDMRSLLIDKLIQSLNVPIDPEIDKLWIDESERRIKEIESGEAVLIPGEKVFQDIERRYKK